MNLTHNFTTLLLSLYKKINRTGILELSFAETTFIKTYFAYKKYVEDSTAQLVRKYPAIFENGHILDIGANIGYTAYAYAQALTSFYKVFAFEPEARNIKLLKKVVETYHLSNKVVITKAAVGDQEGEIELWQNDGHHADHRILTKEFRKQFNEEIAIQKVPLITIDHFLKTAQVTDPISFIKIDVQGYELPVCQGMRETLAANPDCVIWFEYCPQIMSALGYQGKDVLKFFSDRHYHFYCLNKDKVLVLLDNVSDKIERLKNPDDYIDILCAKKLELENE